MPCTRFILLFQPCPYQTPAYCVGGMESVHNIKGCLWAPEPRGTCSLGVWSPRWSTNQPTSLNDLTTTTPHSHTDGIPPYLQQSTLAEKRALCLSQVPMETGRAMGSRLDASPGLGVHSHRDTVCLSSSSIGSQSPGISSIKAPRWHILRSMR